LTLQTNTGGRWRRRSLLFDLDGTLIRSTFPFTEAKIAVLKALGELGVVASNMKPTQTMGEILDEARARVQEKGRVPPSKVEEEVGRVLDRFDAVALSSARLRKDARLVLNSLASKGFGLGIVTSSGRNGTNSVLDRLKLAPYFSVVVTRNDVQSMKPSAEGILKAMQTLSLDRTEVAFVGDSWVDIRAAKDARIKAIALAGGLSPLGRLRREHPDAIVKSLRELLKVA
jgi:phosphoglycolate phosphatase